MDKYRNILVVIDSTDEAQPSLARALHIARQEEHVKLKLFLPIYEPHHEITSILSSKERETMRSGDIAQRTEWMEAYVKPYQDEGIAIEPKVVWHNRPFESIIQEVFDYDHDLVIKGTHSHPVLQSVIFTPTDWHLLRKCPVPVLLVREAKWQEGGNILVALNVSAEEQRHDELNDRLIQEAKDLVRLANGTLHLVNVYPTVPANTVFEVPDFNVKRYNEFVREHHLKLMHKVAVTRGLTKEHIHVVEGLPEEAVPKVAEQIKAELVILGTAGRSGLSGALIGHTAEHIIERLNCDLLALKPSDYVSPLAP